jgi:hypothetical protein
LKTKLVIDLMVPLSEYATVSEDASLSDAVAALKQSHADFDPDKFRHRAILVLGADQQVVGKVNFHAILKALEPKYDEMFSDTGSLHMGFTRKYQRAIFESMKLWQDPMDQICKKAAQIQVNWNKYLFMSIGIILFVIVYYSPPWPAALDPEGKAFALSPEGKGALAVFLLAATWWVFEVVPIGVTSLTIGVLQVLFLIRPAKDAFKDFMDPSVCSSSVPLWWVWCSPKPA